MRKNRQKKNIVSKAEVPLHAAISAAAMRARMTRGQWMLAAAEEKLAREAKARKEAEHDAA